MGRSQGGEFFAGKHLAFVGDRLDPRGATDMRTGKRNLAHYRIEVHINRAGMNTYPYRQVAWKAEIHPVGLCHQVSKVQGKAAGIFYSVEDEEQSVAPGIDIDWGRGAFRHKSRNSLIKLRDIFWDNGLRQFAVTNDVREHDRLDFLAT